jgi:hypothetical protein
MALLALAAAGIGLGSGLAAPSAPQNVADLTVAADEIVAGTIVKVRQGTEGYVPYTEVRMSIAETIKGSPRQTLSFRQLGIPSSPSTAGGPAGEAPGMPQFESGESVILFLGRPSPFGYRTTVGLQQGKFTVRAGYAENATGNSGLFANLTTGGAPLTGEQRALIAIRHGGVPARTFIDFVRQGVEQHWWK